MRLRITFAKTSLMRFTGHLDLHRTWERTIRRAGLPLAYTQGFSPHPRINIAAALPLGFTGQAEVVDIWLDGDPPLINVRAALDQAVPPGIQISRLETVDERLPSLQAALAASEYEITLKEPQPGLEIRLADLLSAQSLPAERRGKSYDLRPLILSAEILPENSSGCPRLRLVLSAQEGATGRPEAVLEALGADPLAAMVVRTGLVFR